MVGRLIIHRKMPAAMNMAIDDALLTFFKNNPTTVLRFYDWECPAITIGRLQAKASIPSQDHVRPIIRRPTGGGLVCHGTDITFSFLFSTTLFPTMVKTSESYYRIHETVSRSLDSLGITSFLTKKQSQESYAHKSCFSHAIQHDIMMEGTKIVGGAQKRRQNSVLHQGSIQNLPQHIIREQVITMIHQEFQKTFNLQLRTSFLTNEEENLAQKLCEIKYSRDEWNFRK